MSYSFDLNSINIERELRLYPVFKEFSDRLSWPSIKKVIFNDPATIVMWSDGTKTVVKAQDEDFDPEKGLAMAIAKKALGNKGNYCNEIKKWTETYPKKVAKSYNPVQKAYDIIKDFHHGGKTTDFDEVLGYLGEALAD